jgi:enterochelin esterase-like enzyme
VVFDESAYLTLVPTPVILDNLIAEHKIPAMAAVLIANPNQQTRGKELPCNRDFADSLHRELMPWVHERYHVTRDPSKIVVGGSSYGGLAATCAGLWHSETFGNVLSQSGSFWWAPCLDPGNPTQRDNTREPTWMAEQFLKTPKLPLRFYMDAGTFENDIRGTGGAILEPSRHLRDVLRAKGYEVHYQENP